VTEKRFMAGNEAIAEAAIQAGCRFYFGYPITPQNEICEYMSMRLPEVGGTFLQAESEVAAIYMTFGAAGTGARVMTSSSSPGISLMQEGILPSQAEYFQATKGGGHGDYHLLVLAPHTAQEAVNLTMLAFDLADKYRNPVMVLGDGNMGQMMEPVEFPPPAKTEFSKKEWNLDGARNRPRHLIKTLYLDPPVLEKRNLAIAHKLGEAVKNEVRFESFMVDDADVVIGAYGTVARIAKTAIKLLRENGVKAGLLRPISLYPFPYQQFAKVAESGKKILVVEMSLGQMFQDVQLAVCGKTKVNFYSRVGGVVPGYDEIVREVEKTAKESG
jgi:2-oxoglutarate ferredoxin oxidoreductase subunit alpha